MQAMLQGTGGEKGISGAQAKGQCDGEVEADNIEQSQHTGIPQGTPNEPYPSTIYCRACKTDKPLSDYSFKVNGQIKSMLCTEHHNELKAARVKQDVKRIAELENIEVPCDGCGRTIYYHNWIFKLGGYKKLSRCTNCRAIKIVKHVPLDFMAWAKLNPVIIEPQEFIRQTKDSEYHKNLERLDTNPRFFNWLCSGSNIEFN